MDTSLNKIKKNMVDKVISKLENIKYMNSYEKQVYKSSLVAKVQEKMLTTELRKQFDLTDAYAYNQTAFELYLDLLTTFGYVNELYSTINSHQMLNESIVNTLHSNIAALNDKLDEYESVICTAGSPKCYIEGFRTQNNQESDKSFYTERYGEIMSISTYVKFNSEQENITLNYARHQNVMVYKSGVQLGEISITKQYGAGFIKAHNSESKLENAIDTSMSSYWSETILSDAELKITGENFDNAEHIKQYNRSFYNLPRGALCEICLTFEALAKINEITLRPFGNFPIDIIAIRYTLADDEDDESYDIVAPENLKWEWLTSKSINTEYSFHFPEIQCKKLYILINQLHCIKSTSMISCNQMFKNELWFNATYDETKDAIMDKSTTVFAPNYLDKAQEDPVWRYINNKIVTNKQLDINALLVHNDNKYLPVTKYQYTYGFYNIAPNFVEFQKAGIYVSQEININNPIYTVMLESEEEHYVTNDGYRATDIEFYITTKQHPAYNDWKPICPKNKDYVYRELLQLDYDYCYLRHKAVCGVTTTYNKDGSIRSDSTRPIVYMNDIVLTEDADYILRYDDDGNVYAVEIANIDHFALYTVSYQPIDASKVLSLIDKDNPIPNSSYEEFEGNRTGCYELQSVPFYSRTNPELTMSYVKIVNVKTGQTFNQTDNFNSPIQCVINKDNPESSYKNFIANTNKIQYYTSGKYLYFNQSFSPDYRIEINYPSFDSKVRVKIILRRNTKKDSWITPVLNRYKLEFTTI